ncbi:hypothetical protein BJ165DRAFT_1534760 [Panaeolus papilionaceus]|nr:hypothetical protein BJ165DRAFT_1534760 [Panaeolus papilionaceus]
MPNGIDGIPEPTADVAEDEDKEMGVDAPPHCCRHDSCWTLIMEAFQVAAALTPIEYFIIIADDTCSSQQTSEQAAFHHIMHGYCACHSWTRTGAEDSLDIPGTLTPDADKTDWFEHQEKAIQDLELASKCLGVYNGLLSWIQAITFAEE